MAGPGTVPVISDRLAVSPYVRQLAAASCAAAIAGALVGGIGGRLAMRLLVVTDSRTTGLMTDDGFEVGRISVGGTLQLVAAAIQIGLLGTVVYLVVRPLLLGPPWLRTATVALGAGSTVAAVLIEPDSFDFQAFDPPMLPVVLFVALPITHVALFAALTERWLVKGSWFRTAPLRPVALTLLVWVLGAFAFVIVAPMALACVAVLLLVHRYPPGRAVRVATPWIGRAVLVAIFVLAVINLSADVAYLV
jgi:hypothetical protein